jgi:CRP-like cAMP-binding protein
MATQESTTGNRLLDLLSVECRQLLMAVSSVQTLPNGRVIYRQDGPIPNVYFPTTAVFGGVLVLEGGQQVEGTTIGREGMLGLPLFLGADFHPFTAISQVPGQAIQVCAADFMKATREDGTLDQLLRRYALFRLRCAKQTGACNAMHSVEERMCRWLLMAHDRVGKDEFFITHEFLSELLGVRRQTVSIVASTFQRASIAEA